MGVVYLAEHEVLQRKVAIKFMLEQYARDATIRERFLREARVMATLDHENIVRIFDLVDHGKNVALVMEYVEGRTLEEMIGREVGPIPHERALPLFRQILGAVGAAHEKGIVHRDLKPANILVAKDGRVKVTDFGIAKAVGDSKLTRTGTVLGSPIYMAPEQILAKEVDHRADIYALGMTLYVMLAGRPPFDDEETSEFLIMKSCLEDPIRDPREFYPHIPQRMVDIIYSTIDRNIETRIESCDNLVNIIDRTEKKNNLISVSSNNRFVTKEGPLENMNFVTLPGGKFMMGSSDEDQYALESEKPRHETYVSAFEIMNTLVTNKMWYSFNSKNKEQIYHEDYPVVKVTWFDIIDFINKLNLEDDEYYYSLPTEIQWEYACRASKDHQRYWWGDREDKLDLYAWYESNSDNKIHNVGTKKPNPWGLYDMLGNVAEWCDNWYKRYELLIEGDDKKARSDKSRVKAVRGGSYMHGHAICSPAARIKFYPGFHFPYVGFRLIRKSKLD